MLCQTRWYLLASNLRQQMRQYGSHKVNIYSMNFDRRDKIDYKLSIKYMNSDTYKENYGDELVWTLYRRNHKLERPAYNTRPTCINAEGFVDTSYPCPICRDEYLVIHPENTKLLAQFINPSTGELRDTREHGVCRRQYRNLQIAIQQAKDLGLLTYEVHERLYHDSEYSKFI